MKIGKIELRDYQIEAHTKELEYIRGQFKRYKECLSSPEPAFLSMSVGAGKTVMLGAMASHVQSIGWKTLILARTGELIEQNSDMLWACDVKNSIYCASIGRKSTNFDTVVGSEGTVAGALNAAFTEWVPDVILIDECHHLSVDDVVSDSSSTQYGQIINHFKRLNKRLVIIGLTGTPFRGTTSILGDFWKEEIYNIGTQELVNRGMLVPYVYGMPDSDRQLHLDNFKSFDGHGASDFSAQELSEMAKEAMKDENLTARIVEEVIELTKERGGVLITGASKAHLKQIAKFLPDGSYGIVTDDTGQKERRKIIKYARSGEIKFVLQVNALLVGVNVPWWDTCVIMRRIGSLVVLVQLIGRVLRLDIENGKTDALILDYSSTLEEMAETLENPILDKAVLARAVKDDTDLIECPKCGSLNSPKARRCCGDDKSSDDGRCDFFFSSKPCPKCGTENDPCAIQCRNKECREMLRKPEESLNRTHYKSSDWKKCTKLEMIPCKNNGVLVKYHYIEDDGSSGVADIFYSPFGSDGAKRIWQQQFVYRHIQDWSFRGRAMAIGSAEAVCRMKSMFTTPEEITHRINEKGKHVIHGMKFSNRTLMGNKESKSE
jgi:superfamily II DNA or RNA helicase